MTDAAMVTIEVDGRQLKAKAGSMLIDVTDAAGIKIPRFCYHKKLSVAANCRMCLVEVERAPKPLPACATPVTDGMKVYTRSQVAREAQRGTMEFLLINHPLDCPICDQGGECELQDVAMGYGADISRYTEGKRVVPDQNIGPLIATDMTRCIHCTRCVRFGTEIAGIRELGATGRGEHMRIGTFIERSVDSELSGNVIDLCPVGALTSKPYRYTARAWELTQRNSIAPHDSVGSNLHVHIRDNKVMRVHPQDNDAVNECWISDRDRFSYQGLYSEDRLLNPRIKKDGEWYDVDWVEALEAAAAGLRNIVRGDAGQLATLIAPNATLEEMYLAQKLSRALGSPHIDYRLRQADFRDDNSAAAIPWLGQAIADLEDLDAVLLVGCNVRKEQPLLGHRLRKAAMRGTQVGLVNPIELELSFKASQFVSSPVDMAVSLAAIAKAAGARGKDALGKLIGKAEVAEEHREMAAALKSSGSAAILLGGLSVSHPDYAVLRALANTIAETVSATLGYFPEAANSVGARLAGVVPHAEPGLKQAQTQGMDVASVLDAKAKGFLLFGVEPANDFWDPARTQKALGEAEFVLAMTCYKSESLEACADILLPIAGFAETSGTYVNAGGVWQSFNGAVSPPGESRPGWKILRVLGTQMELPEFAYTNSAEILEELRAQCPPLGRENVLTKGSGKVRAHRNRLMRIGEVPIYAVDPLVRRAPALQQAAGAVSAQILINAKTAEQSGLAGLEQARVEQGGNEITLPLAIDHRIPDDCVWIPAGIAGTESLGGQFGEVTLNRV